MEVDGVKYNSVEQYFNYHKALHFGQKELAEKFLGDNMSPMDCFRLSASIVVPKDQQTPAKQKEWAVKAMEIMEKGVKAKVRGFLLLQEI